MDKPREKFWERDGRTLWFVIADAVNAVADSKRSEVEGLLLQAVLEGRAERRCHPQGRSAA